ncbi:glycosyltransferase [Epilithonimonas xixisoli]|uniref:Glycosyltransferase involved in cell wall biosynthesis n=1 Tax=Epilithonimonas xixisoli TaxID=1476462 RepID=A0A4R8I3Z3_9FLAO|nr:glycosyltransferase [Epilithonimonas xixisoli]TDX83018.1 glycosyltransferase involved in cell wall biosynthesis [Epilithonimonas xixisoli]
MKKIVVITLDITQFGGTERAIQNFADMLHTYHEVLIYSISSRKNDQSFFLFPENVKIVHFDKEKIPASISKKIVWFYKVFKTLKKRLEKDKVDFILGTGHNINFLLPYLKSKKTKIFGAEHIDIDTIPKVSKLLMSISYPKLSGLIVLSEKAKLKARKLNSQIYVIPNVIKNKSYDLPNQNYFKKIIMVGRISAEKGFDRIIPIAKYLQDYHSTWIIDIYGDGPSKNDFAESLKSNNINNVNLKGVTKNIEEKYVESSIFMLTSYTEAMPMVVLEAKSYKLPVIAYRNEGTELLIENSVNGILVETEKEFVEGLKTLIENKNDIISIFQKASQEQLEKYSEEVITKQWDDLIESN